ncbi:MAG: hypothetical protein WCD43_01485 [Candidatus Acidiferrales bacterium]
MKLVWLSLLIFSICPINSFAQHTPGRVAGSINNAQADRLGRSPTPAVPSGFAPMTADELKDFQNVKNVWPDLTESDFRELQRYSRELHGLGKEVSVVKLATALRERDGDIVRALKDTGISGKQASSLVAAHRK